MFCFRDCSGRHTTTSPRLECSLVRITLDLVQKWASYFDSIGVAPNGLFIFRSKLFGGISNEVSVMFNESKIMDMFKSKKIPLDLSFILL